MSCHVTCPNQLREECRVPWNSWNVLYQEQRAFISPTKLFMQEMGFLICPHVKFDTTDHSASLQKIKQGNWTVPGTRKRVGYSVDSARQSQLFAQQGNWTHDMRLLPDRISYWLQELRRRRDSVILYFLERLETWAWPRGLGTTHRRKSSH